MIARCHHHLYSLCVILLTIISSTNFSFLSLFHFHLFFCILGLLHNTYKHYIHTHKYFIEQWVLIRRVRLCKDLLLSFLFVLISLFCCQSTYSVRVSIWKKDIRVFHLNFFSLSLFLSIININQYSKIQFIEWVSYKRGIDWLPRIYFKYLYCEQHRDYLKAFNIGRWHMIGYGMKKGF